MEWSEMSYNRKTEYNDKEEIYVDCHSWECLRELELNKYCYDVEKVYEEYWEE